MQKTYLLIIFMVMFTLLSIQGLFSEKEKKKDEVFKTKDSQFGEIIEVVGSIPLLKTVQSVSSTNKNEINLIDAKSLKELIGLTPGMITLSTGQSGQVSSTFIRGSKSDQILYIIDGVKIRDHINIGGLNLSVMSPDIMEKVEIVRGPLSNIYGSDAQGGIVNIKTVSAQNLLFSGSFGSHESYSGNVSLFKKLGDLDFSLSLNSRRNSNDIENDVFKNSGFSAKLYYKKNNFDMGLRYLGNFTDSGVPYTWDLKQSLNTNFKQNYNIIAIPVKFKISDKTALNISSSFVNSNYNFSDPDADFNFQSKLISNSYNVEAILNTKINRVFSFSSGVEFSNFNATNETDSNSLIDKHQSNFFATYLNGNINLDNLFIFASVRLDKYKDIEVNFSPQIGFSFLILDRKVKLRASYSNSFKAPLITHQVNPWGTENFDLKPEKAYSYEVGIDYYSRLFTFGLTYFDTSYKEMIDWVTVDMTTWAGQYQNIASVNIKGYELIARFTPFSKFSIQAAYTYLDTEDLSTGKELLRRPRHSFSGLITYTHRLFTTSLQMVYVGKRLDSDPLAWPPLTDSPSFNTFNFNLMVPISNVFSLTGKLSNALNTEYAEIFGYQSPRRRFELGFKFKVQ